jgi:ribonuclease D
MQISTPSECFLFRLNKIEIPEKLKDFIEDENVKKIGLSLKDDFNVLSRMSDVQPDGFIDLQQLVPSYGIIDSSLQKIYAIIFGEKISKSQRLSNWEAPDLSYGQKVYASIDAWACLKIYHHLMGNLFEPKDSPYQATEDSVQ